MKKFSYVLAGSCVVLASLLLSCKKEIPVQKEGALAPKTEIITSTQPATVTECKPAVFGAFQPVGSSAPWTTLAQKWYSNGKVKYLKAKHPGAVATFTDPVLEFLFDLTWGEITYAGNQVYLKDVAENRMQMRVTLDDAGRPVASYYDFRPYPDGNEYVHDTTYYYYDGDRLDYFISISERVPYGTVHLHQYRKYQLSYDSWGNLIKAEFPGHSRFVAQYDYSKPVSGIISNFNLTSSLKILEYMELIKLPMHHAITETAVQVRGPSDQYSTLSSAEFKDYVIEDGLVRSYVCEALFTTIIFYNGWECGSSSPQNAAAKPGNDITSLKQFQEWYKGNN